MYEKSGHERDDEDEDGSSSEYGSEVEGNEFKCEGGDEREHSSGAKEDRTEDLIPGESGSVGVTVGMIGVRRKCITQPKTFMSSSKFRLLYMCRSEQRLTEKLTDSIETWDRENGGISFFETDGTLCRGTVLDDDGNKISCKKMKISSVRTFTRKVTLMTLNHDLLSVVLNHWL